MPSVYAHYRFGVQILPRLPADVRGPILRHRELFDLGLQGPDFFFYYRPSVKNPIRKLAHRYHRQSGIDFFTQACTALPGGANEETLAYLYGLLGHYCLDSACHPFIQQQTENGSISHNALESEFERFLLALDGVKKPHAHPRSRLIRLNKDSSAAVAAVYPGATAEQVIEAVSSMRHCIWLMTGSNPLYRAAVNRVLRFLGRDHTGLVVPAAPDSQYSPLNDPLLELFDSALDRYPELLEQLRDHITFNEPLGEIFVPDFG